LTGGGGHGDNGALVAPLLGDDVEVQPTPSLPLLPSVNPKSFGLGGGGVLVPFPRWRRCLGTGKVNTAVRGHLVAACLFRVVAIYRGWLRPSPDGSVPSSFPMCLHSGDFFLQLVSRWVAGAADDDVCG
jgi:hypothetical protein